MLRYCLLYSKVIQLYIYVNIFFFTVLVSIVLYDRILNVVPCAIQNGRCCLSVHHIVAYIC